MALNLNSNSVLLAHLWQWGREPKDILISKTATTMRENVYPDVAIVSIIKQIPQKTATICLQFVIWFLYVSLQLYGPMAATQEVVWQSGKHFSWNQEPWSQLLAVLHKSIGAYCWQAGLNANNTPHASYPANACKNRGCIRTGRKPGAGNSCQVSQVGSRQALGPTTSQDLYRGSWSVAYKLQILVILIWDVGHKCLTTTHLNAAPS